MGRGEYWFYTQRWMEMLSAREQGGVEELPGPPMLGHENSLALLAWLVVGANLTRRQRQVIRLLASGMRQCEIAMHLGISQTQVSRLKHAALRNMRRLASDMRDVRDGKPG